GQHLDFPQEAVRQFRHGHQIGQQHLHGLDAVRNHVADLVHLTHPASSQNAGNLVIPDDGTDFEIHGRSSYLVVTMSLTCGVPAPLKAPTAESESTSVMVIVPTASSTLRITLSVTGSRTSRTLRLTFNTAPTLTPFL